jgi:hypothetical protein|tara:strand:- start:173 stop:1288 length:1116 start_codon:yes stop_codon:yes gene_type:complete
MHVILRDDFCSVSKEQIAAFSHKIEALLESHFSAKILFCIKPAQIEFLRKNCEFGARSKRILSIIERKYQGYFASLRLSSGKVEIHNTAPRTPMENVVQVSIEDIDWIINSQPALFVENALSDGGFYRSLLSILVSTEFGSEQFLSLLPYHGGGSTLGPLIETEFGKLAKGICLCDRDKVSDAPPFRSGSTAGSAYSSLRKLGIILEDGSGSDTNPFFRFATTCGWSLENYMGPHLVEFCLQHCEDGKSYHSALCDVFPNFPNLSSDEFFEWLSINFRSSTQPKEEIVSQFPERFAGNSITDDRAEQLSALTLPADCLKNAIIFLRGGRYSSTARKLVEKDFSEYFSMTSLPKIVRSAQCALAGDRRIQFS